MKHQKPLAAKLDDMQVYEKLDPSGLRHRLRSLPNQCTRAWVHAQQWAPPDELLNAGIERVVIGGMGGSAIAGDLAADLAAHLVAPETSGPITVVRDFNLPFALDGKTLFIASSHSGNTEETVSLFHQALQSEAWVMAITGGGLLLAEAESQGIPHLVIDAPGEARSAVGYSLLLLLGALNRLGFMAASASDVNTAVTELEQQIAGAGEDIPADQNGAKQLAADLVDRMVVVYGGGIFSGMARRWKTQINENSKAGAFYESIPELLHNSVESYGPPNNTGNDPGQGQMIVVLKPATATNELKGRYRVVLELLVRKDVPHRVFEPNAGPPLSQLLTTLLVGDYVSYYLAMLYGLNPAPNPAIDLGKQLLAEVSANKNP